jgi:hypothetical protein
MKRVPQAAIDDLKQTAEQWIEDNPRQRGERPRAYIRRVWQNIEPDMTRRYGFVEWLPMILMVLEIIKMLIERRRENQA